VSLVEGQVDEKGYFANVGVTNSSALFKKDLLVIFLSLFCATLLWQHFLSPCKLFWREFGFILLLGELGEVLVNVNLMQEIPYSDLENAEEGVINVIVSAPLIQVH
jgi:hypothetical protein